MSEFVRQTVLANSTLSPDKVQTIHSAVMHATLPNPNTRSVARDVVARHGIVSERFLLYPANPWPHKNHRHLIEAFALYLEGAPSTDLTLVCTGAPGDASEELRDYARQRLPEARFAFIGFVPEAEFAALLQSCRALIFPSLYEGFGLPLLEAMACDRPVLCSNVSSLPEVAGDAALLFNPRDPSSLVSAIERLENEPALEAALVERGRQRVAYFGSARDMARKYFAAFEEVVAARRRSGAAAR